MVSGIIEFSTSLGSVIMIRSVTITPKQKAVIKLLYADDGMLEKHTLIMEGADYQAWGNDDDYLGHFCISQLTNGKATIVGSDYVAPPRTAPATSAPATSAPATYHDDTRSVHNDADVARIQTLQEQLDEQAKKLKTIMDLLYKNGSI
jgi:hypothetical protein